MTHHDDSSTHPSDEEQQRVDDLPSGSGDASDASSDDPHEDTASGGAPEQPDA